MHRLLSITVFGLLTCLLSGCSNPKNQIQNSMSPNGKYELSVPIEKAIVTSRKLEDYAWKVTIKDQSGNIIYKDENSQMLGHFNVYWGWDKKNRIWLYNSDDGRIWRWELINSKWEKTEPTSRSDIPAYILPEYLKK